MPVNADSYIAKFNAIRTRDANWMNVYQECADFYLPSQAVFTRKASETESFKPVYYDAFGAISLMRFAAGMFGNLSPSNTRWFSFLPKNPALRKNISVARYLENLSRLVEEEIRISNFENQMHEAMLSLGCFGMTAMSVKPSEDGGVSFANHYVGDIYCIEGYERKIDTVYRFIEQTAQQAKAMFEGDFSKCEKARKEFEKDPYSIKKFPFLNITFKRDADVDDGITTKITVHPYASVWVSIEDKTIIRSTGLFRPAYRVARYIKTPEDTRGKSPAMYALPHVKMMSEIQRRIIIGAQKMVEPPLCASSEATAKPISTRPNAIIYCEGTSDMWPRELASKPDLRALGEPYANNKETVERLFHNDLFNMLDATLNEGTKSQLEVMQRLEERFVLLYPVIGRIQAELYTPILKDALEILIETGRITLDTAPVELRAEGKLDITVEYISRLALAVRRREISSTLEMLQATMQMASVNPEVLDVVDFEQIAVGIGVRYGVPPEFYRTASEIAQIRQQRQQQMEQAKNEQAIGMMADKADKLGKRPEAGSPLGNIMSALNRGGQ